MGWASAARIRDVLRSTFWLVPALCVAGSIALGVGLVAIDRHFGTSRVAFLFPGPPEGARSLLSSITQAMIAFTGLVFSITVLVLQLTSSQFSPRVLRTFLRDRSIQLALGVFVATFVYSMVVQRAVLGTNGESAFVPRVAVTAAFGFVLASIALFIQYINHIANMVRVVTILSHIAVESRQVLEARYPADQPAPRPAAPLPAEAGTVAAPRTGVLVSLDANGLVAQARELDCVIVVVPRRGDFVPAGAPLLRLHPWRSRDENALVAEIAFDTERTMEQDVAFGFRQIVDIAERALSPAVNDPTTAVQAIDALHDLLRRLAGRHLPTGRHHDEDGCLRLVAPEPSFADFLDLAVGEIWHYGEQAAQVPDRLRGMLADLHRAALPEHRPPIERWTARLDAG